VNVDINFHQLFPFLVLRGTWINDAQLFRSVGGHPLIETSEMSAASSALVSLDQLLLAAATDRPRYRSPVAASN
jgi:hypothetical protein